MNGKKGTDTTYLIREESARVSKCLFGEVSKVSGLGSWVNNAVINIDYENKNTLYLYWSLYVSKHFSHFVGNCLGT